VFEVDHVAVGSVPIGDHACRFDYRILETEVRKIINDRVTVSDCKMSAVPKEGNDHCPTFVIAKMGLEPAGPIAVFRSYSGRDVRPSNCTIWEAARATTAAPCFFKEIRFGTLPVSYVDGGLGCNNPSEVALVEAKQLWPTSKHFCLVSIGTGRHKAVGLTPSNAYPRNEEDTFFKRIRSFLPGVDFPGLTTARNFPKGATALIGMARALESLVTNSEEVHQRLLLTSEEGNPFPYFRFNVPREIGDIGLADWKKEEELATGTLAYLGDNEVRRAKIDCVKYLISPPEFNCD
jgi:hypothetical protein